MPSGLIGKLFNLFCRFAKYGTMLEIRDIQFFPDGRSIVDTMGGRRFKVLERNILDGYNVAKVEFLEDEKVADNELHGKHSLIGIEPNSNKTPQNRVAYR